MSSSWNKGPSSLSSAAHTRPRKGTVSEGYHGPEMSRNIWHGQNCGEHPQSRPRTRNIDSTDPQVVLQTWEVEARNGHLA